MAKTFFQPGNEIDFVVGNTAVKSGDIIVAGLLVGIAANDYLPGETGVMEVTGVHTLRKAAGQAVTQGQAIYTGGAGGTVTTTAGGSFVGIAAYAAIGAEATVKVLLTRPGV